MGFNEQLEQWFDKYSRIPEEAHLLCPRINAEDDEDYNNVSAPSSNISQKEKALRVEEGDKRIEITYWLTVVFGYDEKEAGQFLHDYASRLSDTLETCADCVRNWHRMRQHFLQEFLE